MSKDGKQIIIILLMTFIIFSLRHVLASDFFIPDPVMSYNQTGNPYIVTGGTPSGNVNDLNIQGEGLTYDIPEAASDIIINVSVLINPNFTDPIGTGNWTNFTYLCTNPSYCRISQVSGFVVHRDDTSAVKALNIMNSTWNQSFFVGQSFAGSNLYNATINFRYNHTVSGTVNAPTTFRIYIVNTTGRRNLIWSLSSTASTAWTFNEVKIGTGNFSVVGTYWLVLEAYQSVGSNGPPTRAGASIWNWDDVQLIFNGTSYSVEVWHNSSQIADGVINYINATLNFTTNSSNYYSLQIYDWLNSQWTSSDCNSGSVNANTPTKWWCNMTSNPTNYNSSDRKVRIRINTTPETSVSLLQEDYVQYFIGYPSYLEVNLTNPYPSSVFNVGQNQTFDVNSTIICRNGPCGEVFGTVMYNLSSPIPNIPVNITQGDKPFYIKETPALAMKSCGTMYSGDLCRLNWTINATGNDNTNWKIGVFFSSSYTDISNNRTDNVTVSIFSCTEDFNVTWSYINFGLLDPGSQQKPALENSANQYNISVRPGSCNLNLSIKGTDLENKTLNSFIGVGNVTWSNTSNSYSSSYNLTKTSQTIKLNVPKDTNVTTWYWINVPIIYTGYYNGTITITGVKVV